MAEHAWGDKPIKDQSQEEFERRHREDVERQKTEKR